MSNSSFRTLKGVFLGLGINKVKVGSNRFAPVVKIDVYISYTLRIRNSDKVLMIIKIRSSFKCFLPSQVYELEMNLYPEIHVLSHLPAP